MYAALWRRLPGGTPAKIAQLVGLAALFVTICFVWVFPAVNPLLPYNQVTVTTGSTQPTSTPGATP